MPNYTTNLNLEKPLQGEFYNVDIFNANADKIDTVVGNISTNTYQKPTGGIPLADVSSQITDRLDWYGTTTGVGNLVLNIPEFVGTLKASTVLRFKTNSGGTGSVTLNFNGNGNKRINRSNGSQLNRIYAGAIYTVVYDGTNFILQGEGGSGNALSGEILQGRTATTDNGEITGTMPNRGNFNLGLGVSVPPGYYSGGITANGVLKNIGNVTSDNQSYVTVGGLNFTPTKIMVRSNTTPKDDFSLYDLATNDSSILLNSNGSLSYANNSNGYINFGNFKIRVPYSQGQYRWEAYSE